MIAKKSTFFILSLLISGLAYSQCDTTFGNEPIEPLKPHPLAPLAQELIDIIKASEGQYSKGSLENLEIALSQRLAITGAGSTETDPGVNLLTAYRIMTVKSLFLRLVASTQAIDALSSDAFPFRLNYLEESKPVPAIPGANVLDINSRFTVRTIMDRRALWNDIIADATLHLDKGDPLLNRWHYDLPYILAEKVDAYAWVAGALAVALNRVVTDAEVDVVTEILRNFATKLGQDEILPAGPGNFRISQQEAFYDALTAAGFIKAEMDALEKSEIFKGLPIRANFRTMVEQATDFSTLKEIADILVMASETQGTKGLESTIEKFHEHKALTQTLLRNLIGIQHPVSKKPWGRLRDALELAEFITNYILYWEKFMYAMGMNPSQNLRKLPFKVQRQAWRYFEDQGGIENFVYTGIEDLGVEVTAEANAEANAQVLNIMKSDKIGQAFKDTLQLYLLVTKKLNLPHSQSYPEFVQKLVDLMNL